MTDIFQGIGILLIGIAFILHLVIDHGRGGGSNGNYAVQTV